MLQVLEDMESEMRDTFKAELEMFYRMSGVMMQMIMFDAKKCPINLVDKMEMI